jgi:hypothetical protein
MSERHVSLEQLSDIMAFRAIVESEEECYRALGVIHRRWPMVPGRFKDYISTPKRNGYRSLHTTIIHAGDTRVEIQIRTRDMHAQAEFGLAAHWAYKQDSVRPDTQVSWIRDLIEILDMPRAPRSCSSIPAWRCTRTGSSPSPQGRADPAAQGRDADRLRLCRAHRSRRSGGGRQGQRPGRAAAHRDRAGRSGRDPALQGAGAAGQLAQLRDHRQGARRDPPPSSATRSATRPRRSGASSMTRSSGACRRRPAARAEATRSNA